MLDVGCTREPEIISSKFHHLCDLLFFMYAEIPWTINFYLVNEWFIVLYVLYELSFLCIWPFLVHLSFWWELAWGMEIDQMLIYLWFVNLDNLILLWIWSFLFSFSSHCCLQKIAAIVVIFLAKGFKLMLGGLLLSGHYLSDF